MYLVGSSKNSSSIWIKKDCAEVIKQAAMSLSQNAGLITGQELKIREFEKSSEIEGSAVVLIEAKDNYSGLVSRDLKILEGTDGFTVQKEGEQIIISSNKPEGVYFGAHGFLEENADIIWPRSHKDFDCIYKKTPVISIKKYGYYEKPCFEIRGWHACGHTGEGQHLDTPTVIWHGRNKVNTKMLEYKDSFANYGLKPMGVAYNPLNNMDELGAAHPEYFMIDLDGKNFKRGGSESYFNFFNMDAARALGEKIIRHKKEGLFKYDTLRVIMPDSVYFRMVAGGVVLNEQPFVTEEGLTVYPDDERYKSTVYFSFLNETARTVEKVYPDFEICTFAYMYSEECPKVTVHKNITVWLAPINASDHLAYTDDQSEYAKALRENFINWSKATKNLAVYNYWGSLDIKIYSRPLAKVVQKNLQWYRELGCKGIIPEGTIDNPVSKRSINVYEMNELYYWLITRLFWNPDLDLDEMTEKFCRLAYGKAAKYMRKYYALIQKGWDESTGLVRYSTGGETYILQFIIERKLDKKVLDSLNRAYAAAQTPEEKARIFPILETMKEQIAIFSKAKKEDCKAVYTSAGIETVLSNYHADYKTNKDSVWNSAIPLKVLKSYENMEDYPEKAGFEARVLWDDDYIYIGFGVNDDRLIKPDKDEKNSMGSRICRRDSGEIIESYIEMYICGNELNKSPYYGYFSGFFRHRNSEYYINTGAPKELPLPENFKTADFVKYDAEPSKRYYFHIQAIAFKDLGVESKDSLPCGSFVYYNDRYGRAGWKGNGLWSQEKLAKFELIKN